MDSEFTSWIKVVFWTAVVIATIFIFRDYSAAPVEWHEGRVVDKERIERYHRDSSFVSSYSCYVIVNSCGNRGRVSVNEWEYKDWTVGADCQVASRQGHIMKYTFTNIRRQ